MARYSVNPDPGAADQNEYLENHSWEEHAGWHLGLTDGETDETRAHHAHDLLQLLDKASA